MPTTVAPRPRTRRDYHQAANRGRRPNQEAANRGRRPSQEAANRGRRPNQEAANRGRRPNQRAAPTRKAAAKANLGDGLRGGVMVVHDQTQRGGSMIRMLRSMARSRSRRARWSSYWWARRSRLSARWVLRLHVMRARPRCRAMRSTRPTRLTCCVSRIISSCGGCSCRVLDRVVFMSGSSLKTVARGATDGRLSAAKLAAECREGAHRERVDDQTLKRVLVGLR